jgi:hypothetical protein
MDNVLKETLEKVVGHMAFALAHLYIAWGKSVFPLFTSSLS